LRYAFLKIRSCRYRREHRSFAARIGMRVKFIVTFPVTPLSSPIKKVPREENVEKTSFMPQARIPRVRRQFHRHFTIVFLIPHVELRQEMHRSTHSRYNCGVKGENPREEARIINFNRYYYRDRRRVVL